MIKIVITTGLGAGDGVSGTGALPLRDDQQNQSRQQQGPGQGGREAAKDGRADQSIQPAEIIYQIHSRLL